MGKRLVFKIDTEEIEFGVVSAFVETAKKYGIDKKAIVKVLPSMETRTVTFSVDVPKDVTLVNGEAVRVKRKTVKREKVEKQIADHQEKKDDGEKEAYVPPVGRTTRPPVKKIKCPKCNVRKQVVTVAGVKSVKPHTIKGEPCPGSGMQVIKKGSGLVALHTEESKA